MEWLDREIVYVSENWENWDLKLDSLEFSVLERDAHAHVRDLNDDDGGDDVNEYELSQCLCW